MKQSKQLKVKAKRQPKSSSVAIDEPLEIVDVTGSMAAVKAAFNEPVYQFIPIGKQVFKFVGRRLKPEEMKPIRLLLMSAMPPSKVVDGEERLDLLDPEYVRTEEDFRRKARAVACYASYESIRNEVIAKNGGVAPDGPEAQVVITRLTGELELGDNALDMLFGAVVSEAVPQRKWLGFT